MPTYFNPYGRRGMPQRPGVSPGDDLKRLAQALHAKAEQQAQQLETLQRELENARRELATQSQALADVKRELEIKNEALHRQGETLKQVEAELVWARAGLQQQERQEQQNGAEDATWRERYIRLQAELDNFRRRWEQRFETETALARQEILRDMLPHADHLEMALQHGENLPDERAQESVRNIQATLQAFLNTLKRYDVAPIDALGQPFDPNVHEAVGQVADGDVPSGHVARVLQTGYMQGDTLLQPARVLVRE